MIAIILIPLKFIEVNKMSLNNAVLFHCEASPGVQNASAAVPEEAVTRLRSLWWRPRIYGALHALAPLGPRYTQTSAVILVGAYSSRLKLGYYTFLVALQFLKCKSLALAS